MGQPAFFLKKKNLKKVASFTMMDHGRMERVSEPETRDSREGQ